MISNPINSLRSLADFHRVANKARELDMPFASAFDDAGGEQLSPIDDGKPSPGLDISGLPYEKGNGGGDLSEVPVGPGDNIDPMVLLTQKLSARMLEMLQKPAPSGLPYERAPNS